MRLTQRIICAFFLICFVNGFARGQQVFNIKGVVFKKSSAERVSQVLVTNLKSQVMMMSDELGGFSIKAQAGDTLLVTKNDYTPQKIAVTSGDDQVIYLQPVIQLNEVTIKSLTKKQELNEVLRQYRSQGTFFGGHSPPLMTWLNSPLTGLYEIFGKTPGEARRFATFAKGEMEATEVDRRYTRELVKNVTKLPDDEVLKFMQEFTPSFDDLKGWNDYQLIMYIKKSLAYYQKNKDRPQTKLQKLY